MFNFTDTNPTLFNLKAEPFWGMLIFLKPGTSHDYVNVTDVDDNNLGHLVTTNQYGRIETQIIMHCTADVQMWEFTGTQFNVEDLTQFTLIRTERIIDPEDSISLSVDGVQTVNTIDELRALDVSGYDDYTVVYRMGYYRGGDHTPLAYYWNSGVGGNDDGGYLVKPTSVTGMGRWVAIFPDYIDVRWYGVKGADLQSQVTYHSSAIMAAVNRSMIMGKTLYFPSNASNTYYGLDNVDIDVGDADIRMDAGVALVGKSDTTNRISCYNLYCDRSRTCFIVEDSTDSFSVSCHEFWTKSISGRGALKADTVHWDSSIYQSNWEGCKVVFETSPNTTMSFDNCELSFDDESYKFSSTDVQYTFKNMEFTDRYFNGSPVIDYAWLTVDSSCLADIDNFVNPVNWFNLMQDWKVEEINCQGQWMDSVTQTVDTNLTNANIGTLVVSAGHSLNINGGHVDGITFADTTKNVELKDLTIGGNNVATSISTFAFTCQNIVLSYASATLSSITASVDRSQIGCALTTRVFTASHSDFLYAVKCRTFTASYCTFMGNIDVMFYMSLEVKCIGNTIGSNAVMNIYLEPGQTVTEGSVKATGCQWIGNNIQNSNFWVVIDRTYLDPNDQNHDYVYKNNTGACRQPEDPITYNVPLSLDDDHASSYPWMLLKSKTDDTAHGGVMMMQNGSPFNNIMLFTIGTENIGVMLECDFLGYKWYNDNVSGLVNHFIGVNACVPRHVRMLATTDILKNIETGKSYVPLQFVGGYIWKWDCGNTNQKYAFYASPWEFEDTIFTMDSVCWLKLRMGLLTMTDDDCTAASYVRIKATKF